MPIRINLLAEAQAAEEMRRKDPVKRCIWVAGFLVFVVLLVSATLQFKIMQARSEVSTLQVSWKTIEKRVQDVNDHRNQKNELEMKLSALDQFTTNRMLWANALNAIQHILVADVQLTRVHTEQIFVSGGSARGEMLVQALQLELLVTCKVWNPAKTFDIALSPEQRADFEAVAPQLAVAVGAAISAF